MSNDTGICPLCLTKAPVDSQGHMTMHNGPTGRAFLDSAGTHALNYFCGYLGPAVKR